MNEPVMTVTESQILSTYAIYSDRVIFAFNLFTNRFEYISPVFERVFRRDLNHLEPDILIEMVHKNDRNYLKKYFADLQGTLTEVEAEFRINTFNNKQVWIRLKAGIVPEFETQRILLGCAEDITVVKENADVLKKYSEKKNAVLNILSHDLASPLGSIQNATAILKNKLSEHRDQAVQNLLDLLDRVSKKGIHLLQNFVKDEFVHSANAPISVERIDIVERFTNLIEEYKASEKELHITFHFTVNEKPIYIYVDEIKFMQVINNLLSNALKFTPAGGQIFLSIREDVKTVLIQIRDTGIGIPKRYHPRLFEKYSEARRTGVNGEPSVGLGMSIIKTILDWHYAKIWFESEENKGTVFYIEMSKALSNPDCGQQA
jgi:two-component system sensor histidine kinase VicK